MAAKKDMGDYSVEYELHSQSTAKQRKAKSWAWEGVFNTLGEAREAAKEECFKTARFKKSGALRVMMVETWLTMLPLDVPK